MKNAALLLALALLSCDGTHPQTPLPPPTASGASILLGGRKLDVTLVLTEKDRRHAVPRLTPPTETQAHLLAWPRERFMKIESEGSSVTFDVAFLDKSGTIVDLQVLPSNDPEGIQPKTAAASVLLLLSGFTSKFGLKVGDKAGFSPEILSAKPEDLPLLKING